MSGWHGQETLDVLREFGVDPDAGLTAEQVRQRRDEHGPNELIDRGGRGPLEILFEQLFSSMVFLLFAAAGVSLYLGEYTDAGAIVAIIVLNAVLGFFQDYRAEKALAALKKLSSPVVKVRRDGSLQELPATELVPGDIIQIETGALVPADCRLLEAVNLKIGEAALTGESEPVSKSVDSVQGDHVPVGDRTCMAHMGTLVTYGHGLAMVTTTGMETELGRVATSLQTVEAEPTPLQRRLGQLGRTLAIVSLLIVAVVFGLGIAAGESADLMLMTALSLAVAIVPEGLPAVATVALAIGARRMFRRRALIRKLPAVETLGSVTVICSDKTGTLTENRMSATLLDLVGTRHQLPTVDATDGTIHSNAMWVALAGAALCNDAELASESDSTGESIGLEVLGEPTEAALLMAALRHGLRPSWMQRALPRVAEVPFDSERKRMTTAHQLDATSAAEADALQPLLQSLRTGFDISPESKPCVLFMKGAPDAVLEACTTVWEEDHCVPLDDERRSKILKINDQLASEGMRVLALAWSVRTQRPDDEQPAALEQDLSFVGLMGLIDPPRPEVQEAVERCLSAGIRPVMITGDHPLTALSIARQLGITTQEEVVTGRQMATLGTDDLKPLAEQTAVYARVAPHDKLHIVQALQDSGQVVAMTGDGVNDAPALKQAHIGVAMGQIGTDVSKEAADMVLMDDNFATIVNAVEEGRIVYDNIRKFVQYTMTSNAGEVWVMVLGPLLGMPLPLLPLQILWVNLVTDGLPGLALAMEPAERRTMRRPPYAPDEHIMGRGMWRDIAWIGLLMGAISLAMGFYGWKTYDWSEPHWRTIVFTVLTLSQMGNAMAIRSSRDSLFRIGVTSNRLMLGAVLLTFALQLAVVYFPPLQRVFNTTALSLPELLGCFALSTVVFWSVELRKWIVRCWSSSGDDTESQPMHPSTTGHHE